jgi:hypothetical protein
MSILKPAIADKETLIEALENAEIDRIHVFEDVIDGTPITSYIRGHGGVCTHNHTVAILSKKRNNKAGS